MAVRFSTGLRQDMLGSTGALASFTNCVLNIYSGVQPSSADSAVTGTLLLTVTESGGTFTPGSATNGLNFDAPVSAVLSKAAAEDWQGDGVAVGTAGWARLSGNATDDPASASTTLPRIDMSVAKTGGDLNVSNTSIVVGAPTTIDTFALTMNES